MPADLPELLVKDAAAWRAWLGKHHADPGVWLVLAKKGTTTPTSVTFDQALEEALCHGWIDGQNRGRDEATYWQRFTPRRPKSTWSKRNIAIVERLCRRSSPSNGSSIITIGCCYTSIIDSRMRFRWPFDSSPIR